MKHKRLFCQVTLGLALLGCSLAARGASDLIVADFEGTNYGGWKATGEAFGRAPARGTLPGQMPVDGFNGKGLINSFTGGDKGTGTLSSVPFKIERRYLTFLIGGGGYSNETCMNLLVGQKSRPHGRRAKHAVGRQRTIAIGGLGRGRIPRQRGSD